MYFARLLTAPLGIETRFILPEQRLARHLLTAPLGIETRFNGYRVQHGTVLLTAPLGIETLWLGGNLPELPNAFNCTSWN